MDRFSSNGESEAERTMIVTALALAGPEPVDPLDDAQALYGLKVSGSYIDNDGDVHEMTFALAGVMAGILAGRLVRLAAYACDPEFSAAWMVSVTEDADMTRQHLSQFLGHGDAPEQAG